MSTHPRRLSMYELQERLGSDSVTEMWKAVDTQRKRNVAIKLFHPDVQADPDVVSRFLAEAQKIASLHHPNIVQMNDVQVSQPPESESLTPYVVMDYIEGQTLASFITNTSRMGRFPAGTEVIRLLLPISAAIDYAHQQGIIHHDIKPTNILLGKATYASASSTPMLTDFSPLPSLQAANRSLSSALYIAPEQVQGYVDNKRSDLYSFGMILYEMFTGTLPFDGDDPTDVMMQHLTAIPTAPSLINPNIFPSATAVIMRSIAKDPAARYPTANAMISSLARALNVSHTEKLNQPHSVDAMNFPTYIKPTPLPGINPSSPLPLSSGGSASFSPPSGSLPTESSGSSSNASFAPLVPQQPAPSTNTMAGTRPFAQQGMDQSKLTPPLIHSVTQMSGSLASALPAYASQQSAPDFPTIVPGRPISAGLPRKRPARGLFIALIALLVIVLIGSGVGAYFVFFPPGHTVATTPSEIPIVGHTFFISSGLISTNPESSQGITDQLQINMQKIPPPQSGKSYYAWLLNMSQTDWSPISLGKVAFNSDGTASLSYPGDAEHTDLLADNSRFLITEEDAGATPPSPSLDQSTWRYYSEFSQKPGPLDPKKYSLYDHIRHLLAADPKLKDVGLNGGLDIWLFRNTEKIVEWSGSARDSWKTQNAASADLIHRQLSRILAYLDGTIYYHIELPNESLRVDPTIAKVALLEFDVQKQDPPGYLYHIGTKHLHAVTQLVDATPGQKALAVQIGKAIDNVNIWLQTVHNDALKLIKMTNSQLFGDDGRVLLDDLATQANYAFVGQIDPNTNQVREGVVQIHYNIQRLATFDIRECTSSHPCTL